MGMEGLLIAVVLALVVAQGLTLYFMTRRRGSEPQGDGGLVLLQQQIQELARTLDTRVSESARAMQTHIDSSLSRHGLLKRSRRRSRV
jgi:hypothetical protein